MLVLDTPQCAAGEPGCTTPNALESFLENAADKTVDLALTVVAVMILWLICRQLVKVVTRSIETGMPAKSRRGRKALQRARIKLPPLDSVDARLEAERRAQRAHTIRAVLNSLVTVIAVVVIAMSVMTLLGIPVGPLIASAGIAGVALGFGAQSLVKDLLSGMFMLIEDQYGVGDIVDVGEAVGAVEEVGLRSTRLRSTDGTVWYVPNGEITRVGNMTRLWSRVMIEVRFSYDTDVDAARQAMLDAVAAARTDAEIDTAVLAEPEVPGIESFEFNAFMLRLMVQVNPATQWGVQRQIRREMRRLFAERGLKLAVPDQAMIYDTNAAANVPVNKDAGKPAASAPATASVNENPGASAANMPDADGN